MQKQSWGVFVNSKKSRKPNNAKILLANPLFILPIKQSTLLKKGKNGICPLP
jgi:stalled ribosome alternative rescue factor ArfA